MITVTTNQIVLTEKMTQKIALKIAELQKRLPHLNPISANILIKKSAILYHPRKHYHASFGSYLGDKAEQAAFIGTITISLPIKSLRTHVMGKTIAECLKKGLETIAKQLQKYKDLHFSSQTAYPDHQSIRKDGGL